MMITPEEEHENYEDEEDASDYSVIVEDELPVKEEVVDEGRGGEEEQSTTASPAGTSRPTPKPNTPQPTPYPTSKPTPQPTPPPIPVSKAAPQTTLSKPLPKPPPIRCIPDGDDDLHTEAYTDDWNDDRYDRCKRWEKKTGMTVEEYWDLQGIDSELEKNILENMLIMDNANMNKEDAAMKEENDSQPLTTPLDFSPLQDKLDDDLFGEDDLLLMEEEAEEFLDELDDEIFAEDEDELGQDIQVGDTTSEDEYELSGFVNGLRGLLL